MTTLTEQEWRIARDLMQAARTFVRKEEASLAINEDISSSDDECITAQEIANEAYLALKELVDASEKYEP